MIKTLRAFWICGAAVLLLVACGGSDGDSDGPAAPIVAADVVPTSATASSEAFSRYVETATAASREEPLDVAMLNAPSSESDEPIDLR